MTLRILAAAAVVLVPLVTFWTIVFGHDTLYPADLLHEGFLPFAHGAAGTNVQVTAIVDYLVSYYPARSFVWQSLREGQLPLWNPSILGGQPIHANSGSITTFDPFNVLYLVASLPTALAWRALLQDIACAGFMALYLRHLGLGPVAAAFGGLALALNSMFYANIFDYSLGAVLWLPAVLLVFERGLPRARVPETLAAGLVLGIALLSCPLQFCAFTAFALVTVGVAKWRMEHHASVSPRRFAGYLAGVFAIGLLVAMVQILPALELISVSVRRLTESGQGIRAPLEMLTGTLALVTFVFPNLGGNLKGGMLLAQAWGGTTHFQGYIGLVSLLCAVAAAVTVPWRRTAPYVVLGAGAIVLVLYTPLSIFLYERFFILYIFAAAVLAAMGLDRLAGPEWDRARVRRVTRGFLALVGAVAAASAVWTVVFALFRGAVLARAEGRLMTMLPERYFGHNVPLHVQKLRVTLEGFTLTSAGMWLPLLLAVGAVVLVTLRIRRRVSPGAFQGAALLLLIVDLVFMAWTHVPFVDQRRYPLFPPTPSVEVMRQDRDLFRVLSVRRYGMEPPALASGMLSVYGLHAVEGKENLYPRNIWNILPSEMHSGTSRLPERFTLLDLENVKYVMTSAAVRLPENRFDVVYDDVGVRVHRNRAVLPRAFVVSEFTVVPDTQAALAALHDPAFDPRRLVILDRPPAGPPAAGGARATAKVTHYAANEVEVHVDAAAPTLLVLSDVYYPGWRAAVDGASTAILRANVAMRAVAVPAGAHVVRFVYAPWSVAAGGAITILTILVVAPLLLFTSRRAQERLETA